MYSKPSPYTQFKKWLIDKNNKSVLPDDVKNAVTQMSAISMFSNMGKITVEINDFINSFDALFLNKEIVFGYLKELCSKNNIKFNDFVFMSSSVNKTVKNETYKKCSEMYPWISEDELNLALALNNDETVHTLDGNVLSGNKENGKKRKSRIKKSD